MLVQCGFTNLVPSDWSGYVCDPTWPSFQGLNPALTQARPSCVLFQEFLKLELRKRSWCLCVSGLQDVRARELLEEQRKPACGGRRMKAGVSWRSGSQRFWNSNSSCFWNLIPLPALWKTAQYPYNTFPT